MSDRFERIVTGGIAVVTNRAGEVLFIKQNRGPYRGGWLLPGGGIEYLERAADAVGREVQEESGITIQLCGYISTYEIIGSWENGGYHLIMHCYEAEALTAVPPLFKTEEVDGAEFMSLEGFRMHPTDVRILTDSRICTFQCAEGEIRRRLGEAGIWMEKLARN